MKFDLENLNPGTWFYFVDEDDGTVSELTAGVCLRIAPPAEVRRITAACEKKGKTPDLAKFDRLLWDYCIVDWQGIEDANGESIECTPDSKVALMGGAPDFSRFVSEKLAELRETQLSERDLEKN